MTVFAMITTKSSGHYTDVALATFFANTQLESTDIFLLIDNDSMAPYQLKEKYPKLRLVSNPTPMGFAANMNFVLDAASAGQSDVFLLNNDLVFSADWLAPLLTLQPWIVSPLSNREIPHKTDSFNCDVAMSLDYYLENESGFAALIRMHQAQSLGMLNMLVLPFFCVKIPYTVYSRVGKFDQRYGMGGGEDFDFCLRAIEAGFAVKYAAQSFVLHFGGKSSWSGAETSSQQTIRETHFFAHFTEVWGPQLTDLILRDNQALIQTDQALAAAVKAGKFTEVVAALKPSLE